MEKELLELENQAEENSLVTDEYLLPEDFEEEEAEETTEAESETEDQGNPVEEESKDTTDGESETEESLGSLDDMEVKFLHETKALKDIPREELKSYVQKGMNHDRMQEKLNAANDTINDFKDIAEMFDMSMESIVDTLKNQYYSNKAKQEGRKADDVKREYESNKKDRQTKMLDTFVSKYPDVKAEDLPQEIKDAVKNGADLVSEYEKYLSGEQSASKDAEINQLKTQLAELEKKLEVKTQNDNLKSKSVVKKVSESESADDNDPFLQGFWGDH